jgi:O-glycosyl hydrolase
MCEPLNHSRKKNARIAIAGDSLRDDAKHWITRGHLLELRRRRIRSEVKVWASAWSPPQIGLKDRRT